MSGMGFYLWLDEQLPGRKALTNTVRWARR